MSVALSMLFSNHSSFHVLSLPYLYFMNDKITDLTQFFQYYKVSEKIYDTGKC